ncbi:hypothetical protein A2W70_04030 [Candidatus Curtissbacteria bacterium RIFCSPLOWO2_02_41_11]|uniref:Uncharacterized protein n=1 Tax=Candidatus Curtissbacteria bacterium RIFCSPLOWO2_02_41_11 TaxID=1797731 RepID=A0A1F5HR42_9BACT|nr:MAG: hypothetical protein A2W70_04030 [Candidatus Curtissbacteria bacterium RIFCSPLOWO2_02_41_11]
MLLEINENTLINCNLFTNSNYSRTFLLVLLQTCRNQEKMYWEWILGHRSTTLDFQWRNDKGQVQFLLDKKWIKT